MDRQDVFELVRNKYGTEPDYPWDDWDAVQFSSSPGLSFLGPSTAIYRWGGQTFLICSKTFKVVSGRLNAIKRTGAIILLFIFSAILPVRNYL